MKPIAVNPRIIEKGFVWHGKNPLFTLPESTLARRVARIAATDWLSTREGRNQQRRAKAFLKRHRYHRLQLQHQSFTVECLTCQNVPRG